MEFSRPKYWEGSLSHLQGIFPTQRSNPGLLHCRQILYQLSYKENPRPVLKEVKNKPWKDQTIHSCLSKQVQYSSQIKMTRSNHSQWKIYNTLNPIKISGHSKKHELWPITKRKLLYQNRYRPREVKWLLQHHSLLLLDLGFEPSQG